MPQIILIILSVVIVAVLVSKRGRESAVGICATALDRFDKLTTSQTVRKNANKEKILELLQVQSELSNNDIRDALKVSERTVVNYMDELEQEGRVVQDGSTGRGVVYRLR
ncbi:MAG: winged helix-turn-helix domain-containing protein [Candidatus Zambryskibacteria bacterium]|nr:winged helix-turn-helix domain-containing protein [Candidatus Zambryskibacteria bacterium]